MDKFITPLITHDFYDDAKSIAHVKMQAPEINNALTPPFVEALEQIIKDIIAESSLKVIVFSGLDNVFCSGADLKTLEALSEERINPRDILLTKTILDIPLPTIAAMEGHAIGGGLALGLAMDITLIARESRYGCSFMNMGFTPGMGMTRLLEHVVSKPIAHELMYSGEYRKGEQFIGCSGFNYILPKHEILSKAFDVATRISEKTKKSLEILKNYLALEKRRGFEETYAMETLMHDICFKQEELKDMIKDNYA